MNGCGNPDCKCAANLPSLNGHFRHLMRLVNQSLDRARIAPTRRMKQIHVVNIYAKNVHAFMKSQYLKCRILNQTCLS